MQFEWDRAKAKQNLAKHGVDFLDAMTVFGDPLEIVIADPDHSVAEPRFLSVGRSASGRLPVVSYTDRPNQADQRAPRDAAGAQDL